MEGDKDESFPNVGEGMVRFTSRWLLHQIILHLQNYIKYKCIHRKFGTLIFRSGGDILTSLSWALGRAHTCGSECACTCNTANMPLNTSSTDSVLIEAGNIVNNLKHAEIAKHNTENIDAYTQDSNQWDIERHID